MAGGSSSTIGGGGGAFEGPPIDIETPTISDSELRYCPLYTGTAIHHNGITWTFSSEVTWGTYVSGDPWVLVTGAGITITSIEPGFTLVAGLGGTGAGLTFWINGSVKNQPANKQNNIYISYEDGWYGLTYYGYKNANWDSRLTYGGGSGYKINGIQFAGANIGNGFSYDEVAKVPIGLTSGDIIISSESSFDPYDSTYNSNTIRFTEAEYTHGSRSCIKRKAALTAVASIPDCDEFRPPAYWPANDLKNRPAFKESEYVKDIDKFLIELTNLRDLVGHTLSVSLTGSSAGKTYAGLVNDWNERLSNMMISSFIPQYCGLGYQGHGDVVTMYGNEAPESTYGAMHRKKVLLHNFYSMFAPWVPKNSRLLSQRKIVQYAIDSYGFFKDGGRFQQNGGHHQGMTNCYIRFLGWLYDNSTILNYEITEVGMNASYINSRMTTTGSSPKGRVNSHQLLMGVFGGADEYHQLNFAYGIGETGAGKTAFIVTNPEIGLTHNYGLCGGSTFENNILRGVKGATGLGWLYKYSGITLNSNNPYSISSTVKIFTQRNISGLTLTGQFGTLNFSSTFRPRNENTLQSEAASDLGKLNYDENEPYGGLLVKIVGGSGAGDTEYRVIQAKGFAIQPAGTQYNSQVILDRPFENGNPSSTSIIDMYPYSLNEEYPRVAISQDCIWDLGLTGANMANRIHWGYQWMNYSDIIWGQTILPYSVMKYLGITQDNLIIDMIHEMYFSNKYPTYAKHRSLSKTNPYGLTNTIGSYDVNNLFLLLMKNMWGTSFNNYIGVITNNSAGVITSNTSGICGANYPPLLSLVGAGSNNPIVGGNYIAEQVSYTDEVTEETYQGIGKIFDTPQTSYYIKGFVGDNMFVDVSNYNAYDYLDFSDLFGSPSLFINGIKSNLSISPFILTDGKIDIVHEDGYIGPSEGTEVDYIITDGSSIMQHSISTVVPIRGSTAGTSRVTSTLSVGDISRRRDVLTFNIFPASFEVYDNGLTFDELRTITIESDSAYINIAGNLNSVDDWKPVTIEQNMGTYTIDISEVPNKDLIGAPMTIRFFTDPINIFEYDMGTNNSIKYRQNTSVYSRY